VTSWAMWYVFAVILAVLAAMAAGRWRYDMIGLAGLLALAAAGILSPAEAVAGFGHPAVVTVAAVLVVGEALQASRAVDLVAGLLDRVRRPWLRVPALVGTVTAISGFMNDTGALAAMMPAVVRTARRLKLPASRLLMPVAYGSLLGGMITLIGTPANIIIASLRAEAVGRPFALFDYTWVGLPVALAGALFLGLVGWRLAPAREAAGDRADSFDIRDYVTEVRVTPSSPLAGRPLAYAGTLAEAEVTVIGLVRDGQVQPMPAPYQEIRPGDLLVITADSQQLTRFVDQAGVELVPQKDVEQTLRGGPVDLAEVVVGPGSGVVDQTVRDLNLRQRFGVNLLAVSRLGARPAARVASIRFQPGDVLLLQGRPEALRQVVRRFDLLPLPDRGVRLGTAAPAALTLGVLVGAVAAIVAGILPFEIAFLAAALLMVALGVVSPRRAYAAVDWPVLVLIGSMLPYGTALEASGGAAYLGRLLSEAAAGAGGWQAVALFFAATTLLTNLIGAKPAAVLAGSVAIHTAAGMEVAPDPLLMAVAVAASSAFLTPVGHQVNVIVMGPGGYRFADYLRVGLPLTLLTGLMAVPLLLHFWPLVP